MQARARTPTMASVGLAWGRSITRPAGRAVGVMIAVFASFAIFGSAARADPSLMGQWHMDEVDARGAAGNFTPDSSGNGNDLQIVAPSQVAGRWGNAFSFNGASDGLKASATFQPKQITA